MGTNDYNNGQFFVIVEGGKKGMLKKKLSTFGNGFVDGFFDQLGQPETIWISAGAGIWQGLKYKGSFGRGIGTAAGVCVGLATANGLLTAIKRLRNTKFGCIVE